MGAYLFSVPAFAYSMEMGLLFIPQLTGAGLIIFAGADILYRRAIRIPLAIWLYLLFGLWSLLSIYLFQLYDGYDSIATLLKVVLATLACSQLVKTRENLYLALKIYVLSIFWVYYINFDTFVYLRAAEQITGLDRFDGSFGNANTAAMYALSVIWASVLLLNSSKKTFTKVFYLLPILIAVMIIFFSGSKKGMISIVVFVFSLSFVLYSKYGKNKLKKYSMLMVGMALTFVIVYMIYMSPFYARLEVFLSGGDTGSTFERVLLIKEATELWLGNGLNFLVGVGYDNYRNMNSLGVYAHSTPFEILANTGIIGFILFFGFFSKICLDYIVYFYKCRDNEERNTIITIIIFLFIYFFFSLTAVMHQSRDLLPIIGVIGSYGAYNMGKRLELLTK